MPSRAMAAVVVALLVVAAGEGLVISSLYSTEAANGAQVSSLKAQLSQLEGSVYPMAVIDDTNRTVTIPSQPQRVISLAPSNTEIMFALGVGTKLVGATTFDNWPDELNSSISRGTVAIVGGVISSAISLEAVLALRPDLVLATNLNGEESQIIQQLGSTGVPVLVLGPTNMNMVINDVLLVGKVMNSYQNATVVAQDMRIVVNYVSAKVSSSPKPRVFYEAWNNPLITAGPSTFIGQLIDTAGGINIFSNVAEQFPTVSLEAMVSLDPQIIIATNEFNLTSTQVASQAGFQGTSAAKSGGVFVLSDPGVVEQPGPRLVDGLLVVAKIIHPNLFSGVSTNVFDDSTGLFNATALSRLS